MIQRIQTVYLLLGVLVLGGLFLVNTPWTGVAAESLAWFEPVLTGLTLLAIAGAVGAIFLYGTRDRQRAVVLAPQVLAFLVLIVLLAGPYMAGGGPIVAGGAWTVEQVITLVIPVAAYALFALARRSIKKDIELVRSMDRLR